MDKVLFSFGHGYSARALGARLVPRGWRIYGTTRDPAKAETLRTEGVIPLLWDSDEIGPALNEATHLLSSVGPGEDGDPVLARHRDQIVRIAPGLTWAGYLSTTGVYGDHDGAWVDETTPLVPSTRRGKLRVAAEAEWQAIPDLPLHVFRLAGIYGPGRGPFAKLREGTARRIIKPGQVFSRIHVDDIAQVLDTSMHTPCPGTAYNLCDDDPAPPQDVIGSHRGHAYTRMKKGRDMRGPSGALAADWQLTSCRPCRPCRACRRRHRRRNPLSEVCRRPSLRW